MRASETDQDERVGVDARSYLNDDAVVFVDHGARVTANQRATEHIVATVLQHNGRNDTHSSRQFQNISLPYKGASSPSNVGRSQASYFGSRVKPEGSKPEAQYSGVGQARRQGDAFGAYALPPNK